MTTKTKQPTLAELTGELDVILGDHVDPDTGEITPEGIEAIQNWQCEWGEKVERVGLFIRLLESKSEAQKKEAEYFRNRAKVTKNKADSLKSYLLDQMRLAKQTKVEGRVLTLKIQKNPPSCEVTDFDAIPDAFKYEKVEVAVDKKLVIAEFKDNNATVPGTKVEQKESVRIR